MAVSKEFHRHVSNGLKCLTIAVAVLGWILLGVFVIEQYAPTETRGLLYGLLKGIVPVVVAAYLTYKYGLETYFKKREHEQIVKRYLENGVDRAIASVEHALGVFTDNQRSALEVVRALKQVQAGLDMEEVDYSPTFAKYEQRYFDCTPFLRISHLVGDNIFWKGVQLLYAFVDGKSIWFEKDFRLTVKNILEGRTKIPVESLLSKTREELNTSAEQCKKYHWILVQLELVASILQKETTLNWKDLDQFQNRAEIKQSVERLRKEFEAELQVLEEKTKEGNATEQSD